MAARAESYGNVATAPARKAGGDKELASIDIRQAENGGFVVEHRYRMKPKKGSDFGGYCEPERFALADKDALLEHIESAL